MKAHCLPFSQVPHTSRLFLDFLQGSPRVQSFYPRSAKFSEWFREEAPRISYDSARRQLVAGILERQNRAWGASPTTVENIGRLRNGALAAVTGQQVGLFGGPVFSLYKALSAVRLAEEATQAGFDCVPIFWLATQDHDLEEVNQVSIPGPDGQLKKISAPVEGVAGAPVANVRLGTEIESSLASAAELLGDSEGVTWLREAYRPGESFGSAFGKLFAQLFAEWGVILLDASDPELNAIAVPMYSAAIERAEELDEKLLARGRDLEAAGYHQQVKVTPSSTFVFSVKDGVRTPIQRGAGDDFAIGKERIGKPELLERIKTKSGDFSASVLLRPVVQDYLLPTLAYTGGSAETAYFAQASVVYQTIAGRVTPVVPRFSATILEAKPQALLEKYGMQLTDVIAGPDSVRERLAAQTLPRELQLAFEEAEANVAKSMAKVTALIGKLDKTLVEASGNAASKVAHQLESLRSRAAKAELRQSEVLVRHADFLSNLLFPAKALQEREIGASYFISRYGKPFLRDLYRAIHMECSDHQVLTL